MNFFIATFLLILSLNVPAQSTQQARDRASIDALIKGVRFLAKSDLRCISPRDCVLISVGNRSCGGPSDYVLTSFYNSNLSEIDLLAEKSREKEYAYNLQYRVYTHCTPIDVPRPKCVKRICQM